MTIETKNKYLELKNEEYKNDEKMAKYFKNTIFDVVEVQGLLVPIDKERIETSFCFAYGCNAVATCEEMDRAFEQEKHAQESVKHFLDENLASINKKINYFKYFLLNSWQEQEEYLKKHKELKYKISFCKLYLFNSSTHNTFEGDFCEFSEEDLAKNYIKKANLQEAKKDDIQKYIDALEASKQSFIKRLQTYLKKYGLTKLHTWTYLVD